MPDDDVLTRARRVWCDLIAAVGPYRTDGEKLLPELIALAEQQAARLAHVREVAENRCPRGQLMHILSALDGVDLAPNPAGTIAERLTEAERKLDAIRALHRKFEIKDDACCWECGDPNWPCATVAILDGNQP
jgi:hypothetical protein